MLSTKNSHTTVLDSGRADAVWAVAFHPDGMHLFSGCSDGIRRWRLADGQEVGKQSGMDLNAISVSRSGKWIVCGTSKGASVWDEKIQEKAIDVEGTSTVSAVDVSPDATRFATGTYRDTVSVWDIVTGDELAGPLHHDYNIAGVKFSPSGERIATACKSSIRVFDSRNGDQLVAIRADLNNRYRSVTPLEWSNNGQQIFAAFHNNQIRVFELFTGSLLAESQVQGLHTGDDSDFRRCIALAANGKFLATFSPNIISFWDAPILAQIGPGVIESTQKLRSIALSADCSYVATGGYDGKIMIRNLHGILPDSYGPFHAPTRQERNLEPPEDGLQDEQRSTSKSDHNRERPTTLGSPESESQDNDGDLLETEVPTSASAPLFDYDETSSPASSTHFREGEVTVALPALSQALPQSQDALPTAYPPKAPCAEEQHGTADSSGSISMVKRWLRTVIRRGDKNQGSYHPDQLSRELGRHVYPQSRATSQVRGNTTIKGSSRLAAAQRRLRTVAKSIQQEPQKPKPEERPRTKTETTEGSNSHKGTSSSGQRDVGLKTAGPAQQANDVSQPSSVPTGVHVTQEAGDATVAIAFKLPAWMLCRCSVSEDGTH